MLVIVDRADSIDQLIECSVIWQWLSKARNRSWFFTRMIIERLIADLLRIEWFFADSNQWKMMNKHDKQIMNMLSFVIKITKKSLYTFLNTMMINIRRLWNSKMTQKLKIWVWRKWIFNESCQDYWWKFIKFNQSAIFEAVENDRTLINSW